MTERKNLGLLGKDIQRSNSPALFARFFQEAGLKDLSYDLFDLSGPELIPDLLAEEDLLGFNVTSPYKKEIIQHIDSLSEEAALTGAVNTVVWNDNIWIGHNTDVIGVRATLDKLDLKADYPAIIMGNGGASKAVQYVLKERGFEYRVFSRISRDGSFRYYQLTKDMVRESQLIVNTTLLGKPPHEDKMPAIPYLVLTEQHVLFDLNYIPSVSAFMRMADKYGARSINGDLMLESQARASWEIWKEALSMEIPGKS